jgi:hypothetical protein
MPMKIILTIGLFLALVFSFKGQTEKQIYFKKNKPFEAGINIYNYASTPLDGIFRGTYVYGMKTINSYFFNGIYFKYFKGSNGLRFSLNYYQRVVSYEAGPEILNYYSTHWWNQYSNKVNVGTSQGGELKLGYQRFIGKHRFQPYIFTDVMFNYWQHWGNQNYVSEEYLRNTIWCWGYPQPFRYRFEQSVLSLLVGPGLRFNAGSRLTFNVESNFGFYISHAKNLLNSGPSSSSKGYMLNLLQLSTGLKF